MVRLSVSTTNLKTEYYWRLVYIFAYNKSYNNHRFLRSLYLSSSGNSLLSLSHVVVRTRVGSCLTLHSNAALIPIWTILYSGCFRIRVGSGWWREVHVNKRVYLTGHMTSWIQRGFFNSITFQPPTFNLQKDMVLPDPQAVGGNAGVLSSVYWLGRVDLQCTTLMNHISVIIFNAGLNVFEPSRK